MGASRWSRAGCFVVVVLVGFWVVYFMSLDYLGGVGEIHWRFTPLRQLSPYALQTA